MKKKKRLKIVKKCALNQAAVNERVWIRMEV